jgi:signal transduction histidine kinase
VEDQDSARIKKIKKSLSYAPIGATGFLLPLNSSPLKIPGNQYDKKFFSAIKESAPASIQKKILLIQEFKSILINNQLIQDLPERILKLSSFKHFESCHILVHEKGKPVGINYVHDYASQRNRKTITIQSFNSLFNQIKKSKNKIFTQSILLKDDLDVVGNFIGKEIDLKNYSVICLISRNSFLNPSNEEEEDFYLATSLFPPLLNKILNFEKNNQTLDLLIKSLRVFPEKITIKDSLRVIFSNEATTPLLSPNTSSFSLDSSSMLTLELSTQSKDEITAEIFHSQRIALLGELLNTLQHELSNPLFGLSLTAKLLQNSSNTEESNSTLKEICQNASRSQTIIKNFSHLYSELDEFKIINLTQLVEEVITLTKSETREIKKEITHKGFSSNAIIEIYTNPTFLNQIIFNLIINAAQAIKSTNYSSLKNKIIIEIINHGRILEICIIDDATGIASSFKNSIFNPFFTTKSNGTGLGLSICQNLAKKLDTKITFKNNSPFPGATFSIELPYNTGVNFDKNTTD